MLVVGPVAMAPRIRVYARRVSESQEVAAPVTGPTGTAADRLPWDPAVFRAGIEDTLRVFVDQQSSWLSGLGEDAARLVEHARVSVSGGKRFRAAFCWWGHLAVAVPEDRGALLKACASLELLHASALVHDDVMDASDVRRGRPATHRAFEALHRERHWSASPEQYGAAAAILLGDLLLSWSDELLRTSGLPAPRLLDALGYFDLTRTEVVTGQFLDVSAQARGTSDVEVAMTVLRYKSAKYSIERPLHIGAALAGAGSETIAQLTRFGLPLGEAFQLRDDLLGVFGDPEVTGKPAGDDLSEGKRTVLIALALDALGPVERAHLDASLGEPLAAADVAELRTLIDRSGAHEQVEQVITALTDRALTALDAADIRDEARGVLRDLAAAATQRTV
jgi:geranylgeranyl diphosphate synthase type I